jgi:hypothetical protein
MASVKVTPSAFPAHGAVLCQPQRSRWIHDKPAISILRQVGKHFCQRSGKRIEAQMTAVIYNFERSRESGSIDETERLFSALERYTSAELLELLYVGEEPGFFELMRGLFGLSDEDRLALQDFLAAMPLQSMTVTIDPAGRCILAPKNFTPKNFTPKNFAPKNLTP